MYIRQTFDGHKNSKREGITMMVIDSSICQGQFAYVSMTWRHIQSKIYLVNVKRKIKPHTTTWLINAVQTTDKTTNLWRLFSTISFTISISFQQVKNKKNNKKLHNVGEKRVKTGFILRFVVWSNELILFDCNFNQ